VTSLSFLPNCLSGYIPFCEFSCYRSRRCFNGCHRGKGRLCTISHRRGADGDDLRRRPYIRGHCNPAVTLAILLRGQINTANALCYMIAQIAGAGIAYLAVMYLLNDKMPVSPPEMADTTKGLLAEFPGTFALAYVVLNTATAKGTKDNRLSCGATLAALVFRFNSPDDHQ
jgi:hypothetical protein